LFTSPNTSSIAYFTNTPFPIFHRPTFQNRAKLMYTLHPPQEKCFRASWRMVLALGSHYIGDTYPNALIHDTEGWKYFISAHEKLPDLLQGSNLSALQALLLIVSLCGLYQPSGAALGRSRIY
jgi:hypothetical protein